MIKMKERSYCPRVMGVEECVVIPGQQRYRSRDASSIIILPRLPTFPHDGGPWRTGCEEQPLLLPSGLFPFLSFTLDFLLLFLQTHHHKLKATEDMVLCLHIDCNLWDKVFVKSTNCFLSSVLISLPLDIAKFLDHFTLHIWHLQINLLRDKFISSLSYLLCSMSLILIGSSFWGGDVLYDTWSAEMCSGPIRNFNAGIISCLGSMTLRVNFLAWHPSLLSGWSCYELNYTQSSPTETSRILKIFSNHLWLFGTWNIFNMTEKVNI